MSLFLVSNHFYTILFFTTFFTPYFMTDNNEFAPDEEEKKINIQVAPGKMRKVQTIIIGIPPTDCEKILKHLKKSFGCGGNINKETGNVHLQGDNSYIIESELQKVLPGYVIEFGGGKKI